MWLKKQSHLKVHLVAFNHITWSSSADVDAFVPWFKSWDISTFTFYFTKLIFILFCFILILELFIVYYFRCLFLMTCLFCLFNLIFYESFPFTDIRRLQHFPLLSISLFLCIHVIPPSFLNLSSIIFSLSLSV